MKISSKILEPLLKKKIVSQNQFPDIVVGFVEKLESHPQADRLRVATVDIGSKKTTIVCGGWNLAEGQCVAVALPGATLPDGTQIGNATIRGVHSEGMICGKDEIDLGPSAPYEIFVLPKTIPGTPLSDLYKDTLRAPDVVKILTDHTVAVETWEMPWRALQNVVTGKLLSWKKIEGSDKLHHGIFSLGDLPPKEVSIVFGSVYELKIGDIIPIALPGAKMANGMEIKATTLQGVASQGMCCGDSEIGIQNSSTGITKFPKRTPLGRPVAEVLDLEDIVFEVENVSITHRPDLWGHHGFARELSASMQKKWKVPAVKVKLPEAKGPLAIEITDQSICRRFTSCIIEGITVEESPQWMKARLQAVGIRPISNIVDVTNYVMIEMGQPMHAFDRAVVSTDKLKVRFAQKGERMLTLDHKNRSLSEQDVVIEDGKGRVMTLAGIMGGKESEISENTTSIILEAANWNPVLIRKTCQRQELRSDAAQRFEKNLNPEMGPQAIARATELILKMCKKANVMGVIVDVVQELNPITNITVDLPRLFSKIGVTLDTKTALTNLKNLGFDVKKTGKTLSVSVPDWRAQHVFNEDDIVEEVVRMKGYDNIPGINPELPIKLPHENNERRLKHHARDILSLALGWTETSNYSFYDSKTIARCKLDETKHLRMKNLISEESTHLRASMLPSLLKIAKENLRFVPRVTLYELGRTYKKNVQFMPDENKMLAGVLVDNTISLERAFLQVKGVLETLLVKFPVANFKLLRTPTDKTPASAHPMIATDIMVNGSIIGHCYALHPEIAAAYELPAQTIYFEIYFGSLAKTEHAQKKAVPLPKFPEIVFDVSIVTDRTTESGALASALAKASPELIKKVTQFDVFEDAEKLGADKKATAYHITLALEDRTLTDNDLRTVQEKIPECIKQYGMVRG